MLIMLTVMIVLLDISPTTTTMVATQIKPIALLIDKALKALIPTATLEVEVVALQVAALMPAVLELLEYRK